MISLDMDARGVAMLRLARADKHNALSQAMIDEMRAVCARIAADRDIRVVVLAAEGRSFCAGGDLGWMQEQMNADAAQRRVAARSLAAMLGALNTLPQPVIGRVQGNAFGGGVGMACVCDVAIGVDHARFAFTETRLGLIPATIGPYVVARMGEANARRVFMSGRVFDAAEARRLGILAKVTPAADLDAAIEAEIAPYLACAPGSVAAAKALLRALGPVIDPATVEKSIEALVACWEGPEAKAGIAAFFEKTPPPWMR